MGYKGGFETRPYSNSNPTSGSPLAKPSRRAHRVDVDHPALGDGRFV